MKLLLLLPAVFIVCALADQAPEAPKKKRQGNPRSLESMLAFVVTNVCKDDALKRGREFYGTKGDESLVLSNTPWSIPWPADFQPKVAEWQVLKAEDYDSPGIMTTEGEPLDEYLEVDRMIGLRLDSMKSSLELGRYEIIVTMFNTGGVKNGAVIGGNRMVFEVEFVKDRWIARSVSVSS